MYQGGCVVRKMIEKWVVLMQNHKLSPQPAGDMFFLVEEEGFSDIIANG
jgi:hypothetical protein